MPTCPEIDRCKFMQWVRDYQGDWTAHLPSDRCQKNQDTCGRLIGTFLLHTYGPETREELILAFPEIENDSGRPKRRLPGGGNG